MFLPGGPLKTGAAGALFGLLNFVYVILFVVYYATSYLFLDPFPGSILEIFKLWSALKAVIPIVALIMAVFEVTSLPLVLIQVLLIAAVSVSSLGIGGLLLTDLPTCNAPDAPFNFCNDPLYCCVYYASVAPCAPMGPCNETATPHLPQVPSDLFLNPDWVAMAEFTGLFFLLEVVLLGLAYWVYRVRRRAAVNRRLLMEAENEQNYGTTPLQPDVGRQYGGEPAAPNTPSGGSSLTTRSRPDADVLAMGTRALTVFLEAVYTHVDALVPFAVGGQDHYYMRDIVAELHATKRNNAELQQALQCAPVVVDTHVNNDTHSAWGMRPPATVDDDSADSSDSHRRSRRRQYPGDISLSAAGTHMDPTTTAAAAAAVKLH